ncbi:MAG TPA: DUF4193 family protein [Actinomycetota bacterium]
MEDAMDDKVETATEEEDEAPAEAGDEESLDELIAKKTSEDAAEDESEEETVLKLEPEERVGGSLPSNVQPQQSSEFTCRNCFLVKSKSQLADRKRMLCRDCA